MSKIPAIFEKGAEKELDKVRGAPDYADAQLVELKQAEEKTQVFREQFWQNALRAASFSSSALIMFFSFIIIYVISTYVFGISDKIEKLEDVIIALWETLSGSAFFALIFTYILQKNKS